MRIFIFSLLLLFGLGCIPEVTFKLLAEEQIVSLDLVPTSFNESIKFKLQTDQHIFMGEGMPPPAKIGNKIKYYLASDGCYYVVFDTMDHYYFVGGKR